MVVTTDYTKRTKNMPTLQESIDALDRMVTQGTSVPELRSQIAFIAREVAALEAEYVGALDDNAKLQTSQPTSTTPSEQEQFHNGIKFIRSTKTGGKWMAFCPKCGQPALPIHERGQHFLRIGCSARCGWVSKSFEEHLAGMVKEIENPPA